VPGGNSCKSEHWAGFPYKRREKKVVRRGEGIGKTATLLKKKREKTPPQGGFLQSSGKKEPLMAGRGKET